jgi:hypothetical protein
MTHFVGLDFAEMTSICVVDNAGRRLWRGQCPYAEGVSSDWQNNFVSAYASSHPWEDFAETFAHYLHIVDTLETANAFGIGISPKTVDDSTLKAKVDFEPYHACSIAALINAAHIRGEQP